MTTGLIFSAESPTSGSIVHVPTGIPIRTYSASVTGTGTVSATVIVYGSNDGQNWNDLGTITLSGSNSAMDGFPSIAPWEYVKADLTTITGTNAIVNASMWQ